jgi:prolipoprotein diacylglyceryltransferase
MKYILAMVAFVIAAILFAGAAFVVVQLSLYFQESGFDPSEPEVQWAGGMAVGGGFLGLVFLVAGIAVLAKKNSRRGN